MEKIIIDGGRPLNGEIRASGAKKRSTAHPYRLFVGTRRAPFY